MVARGIGAFIQGGFDGYQFGEGIKDRRRQRDRQTELDRIAEDQRSIDNRRNATQDGYDAQDQAYRVTQRDLEERDRLRRERIAAEADRLTHESMDGGQDPAAEPGGAEGGGAGGSTATNDVADAAMVDAIRRRVEPRLTAEQQTAIAATAPANPNPPSAGNVPALQRETAAPTVGMDRAPNTMGGVVLPGESLLPPRRAIRNDDPYTSRFPDGAAPSPGTQGAPVAEPRRADVDAIAAAIGGNNQSMPPLRGPAGAPRDTRRLPEPLVPTDVPAPRNNPRETTGQDRGDYTRGVISPGESLLPPPRAAARQPEPLVPTDIRAPTARPGMTQEPLVNPMRSIGGEVPVSAVMPPPRAPRGAMPAQAVNGPAGGPAPAVIETLQQSGTPSGQAMADVLTGPAGGPVPVPKPAAPNAPPAKQRAADEEAREFDRNTSEAYIDHYREVGAPYMAAEYLRLGMTAEADQYLTWIDTETARDGMQIWGQAAAAAARGDADAFAEQVMDLYDNEDYFPDGMTVNREETEFMTDPETGDIYGARVVLQNAEGETFVQTFEGLSELFEDILNMTAPERAFELQMQREENRPARAQAVAEAAKTEADAQRERVAKIVASIAETDLQWASRTPEEQATIVRERIAMEDRIASGGGQAPAGSAPPPIAVPDWRG